MPHRGQALKPVSLKTFLLLLWLSRRQRQFASAAALIDAVRKDRKNVTGEPPAGFQDRFSMTRKTVQGSVCHVLAPKQSVQDCVHVLYFHGGAYCKEMSSVHWDYVASVVDATGCTVHIPLYPLAPEYTYNHTYSLLDDIYRGLSAEVPTERLAFLGDSAGGGLALGFAQSLLAKGLPQPRNIVLISPWLDLTASHLEHTSRDVDDPWLMVPGIRAAAAWWAGTADLRDPLISPLHGPLDGLGRLTLLIGTRDSLVAECRAFRDRALEEGIELEWIEAPGMIHVWPILPLKEAAEARALIVSRIMAPWRGTTSWTAQA